MINVLLSLDLTDAGDERDGFNAFLAELEWKKLKHVDTVWAIEYPQYSPASETDVSYVKGNISRILTAAAEKFEFARITYVAQIGNVELVGRYIKKKDGEYKLFEYSPF